jgi:hypothetical protein
MKFDIDTGLWMFLPTIIWQPRGERYYDSPIVTLTWLCFSIYVGTWKRK